MRVVANSISESVSKVIIFVTIFFSTWGEGLQTFSFDVSKIFVYFSFFLSIYWILCVKNKFFYFPVKFKRWLIFITIHTLFSVFLFHPEWLSFGIDSVAELQGGATKAMENKGNIVLRFFIFLFFSFSLSYFLMKNAILLNLLALAYGLGFCSTLLLGGYSAIYSEEIRLSAGVLDPNAMGLSAVICFCLNLYASTISKGLFKWYYSTVCFISLLALVATLSRGAMAGFCIGSLFYVFKRFSFKYACGVVILFLLLLMIIFILLPTDLKEMIELRFSLEKAQEDRGAGRLDIWIDYLMNWYKYICIGMGMENAQEALLGSYKYKLAATHNQYLQYLVEYGIVGLCLFSSYLFWSCKKIVLFCNGIYLPFVSLLIAMMVMMFTIDLDKTRDFWIVLAIINAITMSNIKKNANENTNL